MADIIKVLVIDDEPGAVALFRDLLLNRGFGAECALSGKEGLEKIERFRPDVVLLDIKMPEMDGIETLKNIKEKYPSIPVIMLTSYGYVDELVNSAMEKGASGYISKNIPIKQILNNFRTILRSIEENKQT